MTAIITNSHLNFILHVKNLDANCILYNLCRVVKHRDAVDSDEELFMRRWCVMMDSLIWFVVWHSSWWWNIYWWLMMLTFVGFDTWKLSDSDSWGGAAVPFHLETVFVDEWDRHIFHFPWFKFIPVQDSVQVPGVREVPPLFPVARLAGWLSSRWPSVRPPPEPVWEDHSHCSPS